MNYDSFDAGLTEFDSNSVSGRVWIDKNYNGLMDEDEIGIENTTITLKRYYLEKGGAGSEDAGSDYTHYPCHIPYQCLNLQSF